MKGLSLAKAKNHSNYISQSPCPKVEIIEFDTATSKEKLLLVFSPAENKYLQGYNFKFATNDTTGSFSLTLHPDDDEVPFFDKIKPLQIVKIYEHIKNRTDTNPDFVGVVRRKKFVAQADGSLRISIIGQSVAGFIERYKVNLDLNAMSLTNELVEENNLANELTTALTNIGKVSDVLQKIWEHTKTLSSKCLKISNPYMEKYVEKYLGSSFFEFPEEIELAYPLATIFNGQNTIMFWDIVSGIIPYPVYEKFAYINSRGETKIKIREMPFDCSGDGFGSSWDDLERTELNPTLIKSFDFDLSDEEVYTVFYSYIIGSNVEQDKALRLSTQTDGYGNDVEIAKNASVYGYNPLIVNFNGYGKKEGESEEEATASTKNLNKRLMNWYEHLVEMFNGSVTMSTDSPDNMPMCGEVVSFLGGEFYVNAVEHSWNIGGNPETKLSLSRGGNYESGRFKPLENITKRYGVFKTLLEYKKQISNLG